MPATGSLITTGVTANPFGETVRPHVCQFGDGTYFALWGSGSDTKYSYLLTGGAWTSPATLISGTNIASVPHDTVLIGQNLSVWTIVGTTLTRTKIVWDTGAHSATITSGTFSTSLLTSTEVSLGVPVQLSAAWESSTSRFWLYLNDNTARLVFALNDSLALQTQKDLGYFGFTGDVRSHMLATGGGLLYVCSVTDADLYVIPLASGTPPTVGAAEKVPLAPTSFSSNKDLIAAFDGSFNIDLVWACTSNGVPRIFGIKRTGTNAFGAVQPIYGNTGTVTPHLTAATGGDLWVFFESTSNQPSGEVYVTKRVSGSWGLPSLAVGGDADGYGSPSAAALFDSSAIADLLYVYQGTKLYFGGSSTGSAGGAPNTPTNVHPTGYVPNTTPDVSWTYSNTIASDGQLAYEILITRVSDSFVMKDTGKVTSALSHVSYPAGGTALTIGIQYQVQVKTWDAVSNTASAYSAGSLFTPVAGPVPSIVQIVAAGITSGSTPATIASPTITVTISQTQVSGDAANAYGLTLLQNDGVTLVDSISGTLSPSLADTASRSLAPWTPNGIVNGHTYKLKPSVTDAVNGVSADGALWTVTTSYTPPAQPTGFTALNVDDSGWVQLNWTNAAGVLSNVYFRESGTSPWVLLPTYAPFITSLKVFAEILKTRDYAVSVTDNVGIESAKTIVNNVTLGLKYSTYGHWINYVNDPVNVKVALGGLQDQTSGTELDHNSESSSVVYQGRTAPCEDYALTAYQSHQGRTYFVPDSDTDGVTTTTYPDVRAALVVMEDLHGPFLYRDTDGEHFICTTKNLKKSAELPMSGQVVFDIQELDSTLTVLTAA